MSWELLWQMIHWLQWFTVEKNDGYAMLVYWRIKNRTYHICVSTWHRQRIQFMNGTSEVREISQTEIWRDFFRDLTSKIGADQPIISIENQESDQPSLGIADLWTFNKTMHTVDFNREFVEQQWTTPAIFQKDRCPLCNQIQSNSWEWIMNWKTWDPAWCHESWWCWWWMVMIDDDYLHHHSTCDGFLGYSKIRHEKWTRQLRCLDCWPIYHIQ